VTVSDQKVIVGVL